MRPASTDAPGLDGDGALDGLGRLALAREELDGGEVLGEVGKRDDEGLALAERVALGVVDPHLGEVGGDDVAGLLRQRQALGVGERLLCGRHGASLAHLGLGEVVPDALLLHDCGRGGDEHVDEALVLRRLGVDWLLELEAVERVCEPEDVLEEPDPVEVLVLFLVALARPALDELFGRFLARCHAFPPAYESVTGDIIADPPDILRALWASAWRWRLCSSTIDLRLELHSVVCPQSIAST